MCYSGQCCNEGYMGDCQISPEVKKRWKEKGLSYCPSDWDMIGKLKEYNNIREVIDTSVTVNNLLKEY